MSKAVLLHVTNPIIPTHYELQLDVDPSKVNFKATAVISFKPNLSNNGSFQHLKLHCKDIVITSAYHNDKTKLRVAYDKENQLVTLSSDEQLNISSSESICITLKYIGKIKTIKTREDETTGLFKTNFMNQTTGLSDNFVIATHCQPSFARCIFPCIDEPSLKTTFQLSIRTFKRFKAISNMSLLSSDLEENQQFKQVKFNITPLMTTSVFGFVLGDFEHSGAQAQLTYSGRTIPIGLYSPLNIEDAIFSLDVVKKYLPLLENYFQSDYPLDKLDFVLLPFLSDMAMENFGMISVQMNHLLLPPAALADRAIIQQVEQLVVHELVHQWMGNYISFHSWEYLWFNEAFATWCASTLLESNGDLPDYWTSDEYLWNQMESAMVIDSKSETPSISVISKRAAQVSPSQTQDLFDPHSYAKGITIIRSMQLCVGEKLFQAALQSIFQDSKFHESSVKPIDIFVRMGVILKSENIAHFFTSWCQTPGLPIVSVTIVNEDSGLETQLVQHRLLTAKDSNFEDIPYHVPLFITLPNGDSDKKNVLMTDRTTSMDYPIAVCNHNSQGYFRVSYESIECYDQINAQISLGKLSATDLVKIFIDLSFFIEHSIAQDIHMMGLRNLLIHLSSKEVDLEKYPKFWNGLYQGLQILQSAKFKSLTYSTSSNELIDYRGACLKPLANKINRTKSKNPHPRQLDVMSLIKTLKR